MVRVTSVFRGRVQGVGFRATARDVAESFAVSGFVRNERDGSVLCVIEGMESEVDAYLESLHDAMRCNITSTDSRRDAATGAFEGFSVRR